VAGSVTDMKTWYRAVCDAHKSMCHVLVSNPSWGATLLGEHDEDIQAWLTLHYGCNLRLIHHDEDLDKVLGVYEDALR